MTYFESKRPKLNGGIGNPEDESSIRTCQLGGYWAVKSHFTTDQLTPATVSIPTGGGKTALMMLLAYGLEADRVLIVTPSNVVKNQTADKFNDLDGLRPDAAGVVPEDLQAPTTRKVTERMTSQAAWQQKFEDADVVVALPHTISEVYDREDWEDISPPPEGFFDLVFFDEAHHARAPSWRQLVTEFDGVRRVLLTATPFRRDRQTLPGKLVYHYPLEEAFEDGIYEPVEFKDLSPSKPGDRDLIFAKAAEENLNEMNKALEESGVDDESLQALIRTNTIPKADQLIKTYSEETDLLVKTIYSDNSESTNEDRVEELRDGDLDGVIAVGQLGEGFDVKTLKLGVFHVPPKSFPFTLQLIGRVTRPISGSDVRARILADSDQLQRQGISDTIQELYREDEAWEKLIPDLVDRFVRDEMMESTTGRLLTAVRKEDIQPYLSANVYRVGWNEFRPDSEISIDFIHGLYPVHAEDDPYWAWISESPKQPSWATKTSLWQTKFDLHVYYLDRSSDTLFEYTSNDQVAASLRDELIRGRSKRVRGRELVSLISGGMDEFLTTGIRSGQQSAGALANYKMYMGDRVEYALDIADKESYHYGHAMGRIPQEDRRKGDPSTRGVGVENGSVWASGRDSLTGFVGWCQRLARDFNPDAVGDRVEKLGLRYPSDIETFPETPFHAAVDPEWYRHRCTVTDQRDEEDRPDDTVYANPKKFLEPEFEILSLKNDGSSRLQLEFYPQPELPGISCEYDVESDTWHGEITKLTFYLDKPGIEGERFVASGGRFLRRYPPQFHLGTGVMIRGGTSFELALGSERLPKSVFSHRGQIDWSSCDRRVEFEGDKSPREGCCTVHEWVEMYIGMIGDRDQIVFRDHGSPEIADYIQIEPDRSHITFYHCKSGKTNESGDLSFGASLGHVKDVLDQVLRSRIWIRSTDLITQIQGRNRRDINPEFRMGEESFGAVADDFAPEEWTYEVVAVVPTLEPAAARSTDRVNTTLLTCREWLQQVGSEFTIIGERVQG